MHRKSDVSHTPRRRPVASHQRLTAQALELSVAAPQVVAERLTRLALSPLNPSLRDHDEFMRMGSEKVEAFQQSWMAMWSQAWQAQLDVIDSVSKASVALAKGQGPDAGELMMAMPGAAAQVLSAGLAPVHGKAVANARRLKHKP